MSNKLSINRQRLFTQGYRKYLQSLSHGSLVDFVLNGGDLAFSPAQERELLLDQVADEQGRHARATQKINELVRENRRLTELLNQQAPVSTDGSFEALLSEVFGGDVNIKVLDGTDYIDVSYDDVLQMLASIFADTSDPVPTQMPIVTFEDYEEAFPNAVFAKTMAIELGDSIPADVIAKCDSLKERYQPFATTNEVAPGSPLRLVVIQFCDAGVANDFAAQAKSIGITPAIYGLYVVNHAE